MRLAFFFDQEAQQEEKAEFNNNRLKYRNEIQQHQWELRLLLLRRLSQMPEHEELVRGITNGLDQFLTQFKQFLVCKCDADLFKSNPERQKLEQRPTLELDPGSHWALLDSLEFFASNNLERFRALDFLKAVFESLKMLLEFVQKNDSVVIKLSIFEKLKTLSAYRVEDNKFLVANVWMNDEPNISHSF